MLVAEIIWVAGGIVLILGALATAAWALLAPLDEEEERAAQPASHPRQRGLRCCAPNREAAAECDERHARASLAAARRRSPACAWRIGERRRSERHDGRSRAARGFFTLL
jgi:hypothetical protein